MIMASLGAVASSQSIMAGSFTCLGAPYTGETFKEGAERRRVTAISAYR